VASAQAWTAMGHFSPSPLWQLSSQSGPKIKVLRWVGVKAPSAVVWRAQEEVQRPKITDGGARRMAPPDTARPGQRERPRNVQSHRKDRNRNRRRVLASTSRRALRRWAPLFFVPAEMSNRYGRCAHLSMGSVAKRSPWSSMSPGRTMQRPRSIAWPRKRARFPRL
jgi:hypothetical protein